MTRPLSEADRARGTSRAKEAARQRAQALLAVADGRRTLIDVVMAAPRPEYKSYLRIDLHQLAGAQPGVGSPEAFLDRFYKFAGEKKPAFPTVGWMLDSRCGGRRVTAWADAAQERGWLKTQAQGATRKFAERERARHRSGAWWPGAPFTPRPVETTYATVAEFNAAAGQRATVRGATLLAMLPDVIEDETLTATSR
ncbi:hypothetical protein IC607_02540 [Cellulomonas sp. JH27-2]|uniref:hypothetical protein n=1 Tax=Cellulomonas sp. JH27-2 TaxID=2774139 RepID=UPI001781F6BF|nr:hypothetical protein [Cellulomonas sp. JH27-2]MBD8057844.1 hypothetical protein [Cellulomonas sp. JH27-2]